MQVASRDAVKARDSIPSEGHTPESTAALPSRCLARRARKLALGFENDSSRRSKVSRLRWREIPPRSVRSNTNRYDKCLDPRTARDNLRRTLVRAIQPTD